MSDYYAPKVDSVSAPTLGALGAHNYVSGEVIKAEDLPDHVKEELKNKDSWASKLLKPVANTKAEKYLAAREAGASHDAAAEEADLDDSVAADDRPTHPTKAQVEAKAAKGEGKEPVAGSSTAHAVPDDQNPTPQIANAEDAKRREATEHPPAAKDAKSK